MWLCAAYRGVVFARAAAFSALFPFQSRVPFSNPKTQVPTRMASVISVLVQSLGHDLEYG
jgi:hypothetical protein